MEIEESNKLENTMDKEDCIKIEFFVNRER